MSIQILNARDSAIRKVNEELILLYWNVGKYIAEELESQKWGSSYVDEFVSTLWTQISWSNHLLILSSAKTEEEREFYIKLCFIKKFVTNINIRVYFKAN